MFRPKTVFITLVVMFTFILPATGQGQIMDFGLSAGINVNTHTGKFRYSGNYLTPEINAGYHAGLIARTKLSKILRAALEPSLILLGARYNEPVSIGGTSYQADTRTQLLYLHLPLLLQFIHTPSPDIAQVYGEAITDHSYHFTAGFFGEYLLDARHKGTLTAGDQSNDISRDVILQYSRYDAGAVAGIGVEFQEQFGIESRFQYTLLQAYNGTPRYKPKNYALTLSLYVLF